MDCNLQLCLDKSKQITIMIHTIIDLKEPREDIHQDCLTRRPRTLQHAA